MTQILPKDLPKPSRRGTVVVLLALLIVAFFCNNLFVPAGFHSGPGDNLLVGFVIGACIAQLNLISVWAAISQGHVIIRLPWAYLLVEIMWASLVLGNRWDGYYLTNGDMLSLGVVLAVCCTVAQVPLWIASRVYHWRLLGPSTSPDRPDTDTSQFQLGHMFLGTVILAVSLAASRPLFLGSKGDYKFGLDGQMYFLVLVLAVVNLVTVIPAIWAAFFMRVSLPMLGIWLSASLGITAIEMAVLCAALGLPPSLFKVSVVFLIMNATQIGVVFFVLKMLIRAGFRFAKQRETF